MTPEEWEAKYNRLFSKVRQLRGWQKQWDMFHASLDYPKKRKMERVVDQMLNEELKLKRSLKQELF